MIVLSCPQPPSPSMPALPDTESRGVDGAFRVLVTGFGVSSTPLFVASALANTSQRFLGFP